MLNICDRIDPDGVIVQFGGQTPLNLARALSNAGVPIIGTSVNTIEDAEDREKFKTFCPPWPEAAGQRHRSEHGPSQEPGRPGRISRAGAAELRAGRPGDGNLLRRVPVRAIRRRGVPGFAGQPVLIDRFLEDAIEVNVDAIADGRQVIVAGIMEHIEEAGVHSGDSACAIPPYSLRRRWSRKSARPPALGRAAWVKGLMNIQYAVKHEEGRQTCTSSEVNPRASRTVPFVSKATGMPLAKVAAKVMVGVSLAEQGYVNAPVPQQHSVKEAVFPFAKFAGIDIVLGPEMKSTGEVMGVSEHVSHRIRKEPDRGGHGACPPAARSSSASPTAQKTTWPIWPGGWNGGLRSAGHQGHRMRLEEAGIRMQTLLKIQEGHPNVVNYMIDGNLQLVINTPERQGGADRRRPHPRRRSFARHLLHHHARRHTAAVGAMEALRGKEMTVQAVQDRFAGHRQPVAAPGQ